MAQNDLHTDLSVEKILSEVKAMQGDNSMRLWSLRDVDDLLAENGASTEPAAQQPNSLPVTARTPKQGDSAAKPVEANAESTAAPQEPAPLLAGATPQQEKEVLRTSAKESVSQPLPGQITIEKTRVFNEVESHAVHHADIEHRIGKKVLRTTTGEFDPIPKKPVMETDARRERFLNRPEQKLEKTMEHKKLLEQLPPKTIEKPGVIVRKAPKKTDADGLQAIPTLVLPEDELKAQQAEETRVQQGSLKSYAYKNPIDAADEPLKDQIILDGFDTEAEPVTQIDEEQAEMSLLARRREKAKKFRLFPGLETAEEEAETAQELDPAALDAFAQDFEEEKTRPCVALSEEDAETPFEDTEHNEETESSTEEDAVRPHRRRRKKPPQSEDPIPVLREFYGPKDAQAVYDLFLSEKRGHSIRLALSVILMLAAAASAFLVRLTGDFTLFNDSASVYSAVQLIFVLIFAVLGLKDLKSAVLGLVKRRNVSAQTGLLCAVLFALVQTGVSFAYPESLTSVPLYTAVAGLSFVLYYAGKKSKLKADMENFEMVAENYNRFYGIYKINEPDTAFEIGRGLLLGDPDVRYSKRIAFPSKFVETAKRNETAFDVYALALPAVLIAAGVVGAITCFVANQVFTGVSAMTAIVLGGMPLSSVCASASALNSINKRLRKEGAMLSGYNAAFDTLSANAVVLDASELFDASRCRLRGMKIYHKMRVDEAILYTAAMVIQSGGTLESVFDGVILQKREMLPQVESLAYEERLGCSGWIYNQRVLVGNRELLMKHNVDAPTREEEQRFRKDGCEVIYLAVEGKTAALFVVEYAANERLAGYLQALEKYGISILVRTSDPNITEGLVEQYFDLPHNLVKMINPVAGSMFRELLEEQPSAAPCTVLHNGNPAAFLRALLSAFVLDEKYRLSQILLYIGVGLSITLLAVLSFFTGLTQAGALEVLIFELIWSAIVLLIPKIKKV